jgi:hypothetical protein
MKIVRNLIKLGFFSLPIIANAQTHDLYVLGQGVASCGTWNVDRSNPDTGSAAEDESWVLGFLYGQGLAFFNAHNESVAYNTDANGVFGWLDNYCKANPTQNISIAATQFVVSTQPFIRSNQ